MSAIWDGDTGHVTITAIKGGAAVNLTAATVIVVIARNIQTDAATVLDEATGSDKANGIIVADGSALDPGDYQLVLRVTDAGGTATYPSADKGAERLTVLADLDAV